MCSDQSDNRDHGKRYGIIFFCIAALDTLPEYGFLRKLRIFEIERYHFYYGFV